MKEAGGLRIGDSWPKCWDVTETLYMGREEENVDWVCVAQNRIRWLTLAHLVGIQVC